jgi:hypothetical protein
MEECDDQEIEDIVLTPDTADHSSSKDEGDDDKVANAAHESGARIASKLKTSPFCPVKGSERHRIDQAETDTCEGAILDNVSESESGSAVHQNVADKCNVIIQTSWREVSSDGRPKYSIGTKVKKVRMAPKNG